MSRLIMLPALLLAFVAALITPIATARADDVSVAGRGVVRVVTVAIVNGEVVGFGHGSGFAISPSRIITNAHVVRSAVEYPQNVVVGVVPSEGKQSYEARLIAVDAAKDLAIIEMVNGSVSPVALYTGPVEPGTDVVALGYPGNVDLATARSATDYITPMAPVRSEGNFSNTRSINGVAVLVHNAAIARGNSGGPLVDECGRVLGVNSIITRADEGDSTFAFAIANRELTQFLARAGQKYSTANTPCVSLAEATAAEKERLSAAAAAKAQAEAAEASRIAADRQSALSAAEAAAQTTRENRIAIAILLFVAGAFAGGYALMLHGQRQRDAALRTRFNLAVAVSAGCVIVAAIAFLTRPTGPVLPPAGGPAAQGGASGGAAPAGQAPAAGQPVALRCIFQPNESRITVSNPGPVDFSADGRGCINNRTQYAPLPDGRWQRVIVSASENSVGVATWDGAAKSWRNERYLLGADAMAQVRRIKAQNADKACSADPAYLQRLATQQEAVRAALPPQPNEWLLYSCAPQAPATP